MVFGRAGPHRAGVAREQASRLRLQLPAGAGQHGQCRVAREQASRLRLQLLEQKRKDEEAAGSEGTGFSFEIAT